MYKSSEPKCLNVISRVEKPWIDRVINPRSEYLTHHKFTIHNSAYGSTDAREAPINGECGWNAFFFAPYPDTLGHALGIAVHDVHLVVRVRIEADH